MESRCIATAGDANYYPGVIALLRSLGETNPDIPVVVFDGGFTERQSRRVGKYARIIRAKPFLEIEGRGKFSYIGLSTMLKFEVIELDYDKVIFLDADIVVKGTVNGLFNIPEGSVGVVRENTAVKNIFRAKDRQHIMAELDIDPAETVFNGGIFVLRPSEWKDLKERAKNLIELFGKDVFSKTKDHQFLNVIFAGKTYTLPGKYNFSPLYDEGKITDPVVIHYLEKRKPWQPDYPDGHRYGEFRQNISLMDCPRMLLVDAWRKIRAVWRIARSVSM